MIHHVENWMFDLPLERFILTFDDGYLDHWHTFQRFLEIPTKKIYFVTGNWVGQRDFLTVDHIQQMMQHADVDIGAHGFQHHRISRSDLDTMIKIIASDTEHTITWFQQTLGTVPTKFCYPYNDCIHGIYTQILQHYGFREFYGAERIDISWLKDQTWLESNNDWIFAQDMR